MTRALRNEGNAEEKRGRKGQKAFCMFQLLRIGLQFLWIACAQAQGSLCTSQDVDAYIQCVSNNPCRCYNCDPNPLDSTPVINVDTPPQDCRDVNRIFCPLIRCCSTCEDVARSWYECTFQAFALETIGIECSATCDGYDYGDVEGECEPSVSPAPSLAPSHLPIEAPVDSSARPTTISSIQRSSDVPSNAPSFATQAGGDTSVLPKSGCQSSRQGTFDRSPFVLFGALIAVHLM
jgi:hypothetical protein